MAVFGPFLELGQSAVIEQSDQQEPMVDDGLVIAEALKMQTDDTLVLACQQLGILQSHLLPQSMEAFGDKTVSRDIVEMRFNHFNDRRAELAQNVRSKYKELKGLEVRKRPAGLSEANFSVMSVPGDPQLKLAAEERKLETLARRRQEEVARMLDFQMKQREAETRHQEVREAEQRRMEDAKVEAQRRQRQRLEDKRRRDEELAAEERRLEEESEQKRKAERAREREHARQEEITRKRDRRLARRKEEERKAVLKARQEETQALFESYEQRVQQRAAEHEERKRERQLKFQQQQAETRRLVQERQEKARGRGERLVRRSLDAAAAASGCMLTCVCGADVVLTRTDSALAVEAARQNQARRAEEARLAYEERERQAKFRKEASG